MHFAGARYSGDSHHQLKFSRAPTDPGTPEGGRPLGFAPWLHSLLHHLHQRLSSPFTCCLGCNQGLAEPQDPQGCRRERGGLTAQSHWWAQSHSLSIGLYPLGMSCKASWWRPTVIFPNFLLFATPFHLLLCMSVVCLLCAHIGDWVLSCGANTPLGSTDTEEVVTQFVKMMGSAP